MLTSPHPQLVSTNYPPIEAQQNQQFMAFIRNRLNVIGTSMYLLENTTENDPGSQRKYINNIKFELEILRKSMNETTGDGQDESR